MHMHCSLSKIQYNNFVTKNASGRTTKCTGEGLVFSMCVFYVNHNGLDSVYKSIFYLFILSAWNLKGFWNQKVVFLVEFYVNWKVFMLFNFSLF